MLLFVVSHACEHAKFNELSLDLLHRSRLDFNDRVIVREDLPEVELE